MKFILVIIFCVTLPKSMQEITTNDENMNSVDILEQSLNLDDFFSENYGNNVGNINSDNFDTTIKIENIFTEETKIIETTLSPLKSSSEYSSVPNTHNSTIENSIPFLESSTPFKNSTRTSKKSKASKPPKNFTEIATDEELSSLVKEFFDADQSNLFPYIQINLQGYHNTSNATEDRAPEPLLSLSDEVYELNTIQKMISLYDNFERNSSVDELETDDEMREESELIQALLDTAVIQKLIKFLEKKKLLSSDSLDHFALLKTLWFDFYPRNKGTNSTSSGFEHVFMTEIKKGKIIGTHNWIYFAHLEKIGELNYKGWLRYFELDHKTKIIKLRFDINGRPKMVSSMFIGTSPELEFAIYTLCFKLRANRKCNLSYNNVNFTVNSFSFKHKNKKLIASAFIHA